MRKIITEKTVYPFAELPESAKEKALDHLCSINVDYKWWEAVYDDANQVGINITSFNIDRASYCKGEFFRDSLFSARAIVREHGPDCETYKTSAAFLSEYEKLSEDEKEIFIDEDDHDLAVEFKKSILEDYRINLTKEHEYLTSDQTIIETIDANEYEFDENGNLA